MSTETVRLHISPFTPDLLDRVVPPSLRPSATNISFHTVPTFPEKGFGYVNLPLAEAQRLKTKLNGTTLKGNKVRIEDAKPEKPRIADGAMGASAETETKRPKKEKKIREQGILPGHELESGRRVKRGWAEADGSDDRKKVKKSKKSHAVSKDDEKGLEGKAMQFKTRIPANASSAGISSKDESADKKKKKREKRQDGKTIVQEFSKTKKVRDAVVPVKSPNDSANYENGKGWVNEAGEVVEGEAESVTRKRRNAETAAASKSTQASKAADHIPPQQDSETPSAISESEPDADSTSGSDDDDDSSVSGSKPEPVSTAKELEDVQTNTDSADLAAAPKEVHPLEALFKRPAPMSPESSKKVPAPIDTSFSFFATGAAEDDEQGGGHVNPPQTPHTQRDLEWRGLRSGAPTPDTAAIGKRFNLAVDDDEDEDDSEDSNEDAADAADDHEMQGSAASPKPNGEREESAFRKWFYENRGDLNRGWKKRRREEKKMKRKRENQRLNRKVA